MSATQLIDISHQRFGSLEASTKRQSRGKNSYWLCNCDCGNIKWIRLDSLITGTTRTCGHGSFRHQGTNENGKRFGRLLLSNRRLEGKNVVYDYRCECGKVGTVAWRHIKHGETISCGCSKRSRVGNNSAGRVYYNYKSNALKRKLSFALTPEQFSVMVVQACHYCGAHLTNTSKSQCSTGDFKYTGIDRKDSKIGYSMDNCVPCCAKCNRGKWDKHIDDFAEWIRTVYWHFYVGKMGGTQT